MSSTPDLSKLASYVRNRLQEQGTATIVLQKRRVHIVAHTTLGQTIPGLLVASDKGESIWLEGATPVHATLFVAGGFSLQRAGYLARLFDAIRGTNTRKEIQHGHT